MRKFLTYIIFFNFFFPNCVTFNLDLNNFSEYPNGNWVVKVNGSWNGWGQGFTLNDHDSDGIYSVTDCGLSDGEYQYIFAITGDFDNWSNWGMVSNPPLFSECDYNPNDSYANYGFNLSSYDLNLETHAWDCCGFNNCDNWEGCSAGGIKTESSYLYGRFEVRMKSIDSDGVVSSFFTYNTNWQSELGNLNWNEIDVEMTGNRDSSVQFTTHHPGSPNPWSYGEIVEAAFNPHQDFHDYAFEWTPFYIKWYVDGEQVYEQSQSIVDDLNFSQNIMMNVWPAIWEDWVGEWDNQNTAQHAYYDYVKYYSYVPGSGNYGTDNNFELLWIDNFDSFNDMIWEDNSSGSFSGNLCDFNPSNTNFYNGHLILTLSDSVEEIDCNQISGDISYDSNLNVIDIVLSVDLIISGLDSLDICQLLSVDFNFDQSLDVIDIVHWVEVILDR